MSLFHSGQQFDL